MAHALGSIPGLGLSIAYLMKVRSPQGSVRSGQCAVGSGQFTKKGPFTGPGISREPAVGIEPTTARLRIECSTTELRWRSTVSLQCPGADSNRDALRHHPLK